MKRKALSKSVRFKVFDRDSFTCQYCGRQPPEVILNVDHVVPVSKGGTNEIDNLTTSCADCNAGKSDKRLGDGSLTDRDRARMAQERLEAVGAAELATRAVTARCEIREALLEYFCDLTGEKTIQRSDLTTLTRIADEAGTERTLQWMDIAMGKTAKYTGYRATSFFKYICGIARNAREQQEAVNG